MLEVQSRILKASSTRKPKVFPGVQVAEPHTPIYKMHKYFARRPQNVFRELIGFYTKPGDVIFDPFCGGGVTVFEGISTGRRVIGNDVNPLAIFVTRTECASASKDTFLKAAEQILKEFTDEISPLYQTENRDSGNLVEARWFEHAYTAECSECKKQTVLANDYKIPKKSGWYYCSECKESLQAVALKRNGHKLLSVTYKLTTRATQKTVVPNQKDIELSNAKKFKRGVKNLDVQSILIPEFWDRQQEDCLHRKGVESFADFFTMRNLYSMNVLRELIRSKKGKVSDEIYQLLLLMFSATLRYTNNLTISTKSWMDGRPVAWAKHAYWLSNQFVEVNPIEYLEKRIEAIESALEFQGKVLPTSLEAKSIGTFFSSKNATHYLSVGDSAKTKLPAESIDCVITDPPYGANVQYGELSAFWLAWLYKDIGIDIDKCLSLESEVLVNRKRGKKKKNYEDYFSGLHKIFSECHRVLVSNGKLIFTFNNKDPLVWACVIKATSEAGFELEPGGIVYQSQISNYASTAHTRFDGTATGDFIYVFKKISKSAKKSEPAKSKSMGTILNRTIKEIEEQLTVSEMVNSEERISFFWGSVLPELVRSSDHFPNFREFSAFVSELELDKWLERHLRERAT